RLQWIRNSPKAGIARWAALIMDYDFTIKYRSGKNMAHADFLSRLHEPDALEEQLADWVEPMTCLAGQINVTDNNRAPGWAGITIQDLETQEEDTPEIESLSNLGVLHKDHRHWVTDTGRIYVPQRTRHVLIEETHKAYNQHLGQRKLRVELQKRYWWPHMGKDIIAWVKGCEACLTSKQ